MKKEESKKTQKINKTKNKTTKNNTKETPVKENTQTEKNIPQAIAKEKYKPNKLIIILSVILIIVIIISLIVNLTTKDNDTQIENPPTTDENEPIINTNEGVVKEQEIEGLTFTQTSLISQDGESYLTTAVKNNNNTDYELKEIHIIIKDKEGNSVISYQNQNGETINYLVGYIGNSIPAGETKNIVSTIDKVISNDAHTIEYEIIK